MRSAGVTRVAAPPAAVRAVLEDPERLATALPHVDGVELLDEEPGAFAAVIRPATALGEVPFATTWRRRPAGNGEALRYAVAGRSEEYLLELEVGLSLNAADPGATDVAWEATGGFTGALASVGQRVLVPVVAHQVELVIAAAGQAAGRSPSSPSGGAGE